MNEEIKYALNKFKDAFSRLNDGVLQAKDELDRDGVIQRFEFTFELLWKCLKVFLEREGIKCATPRDCLKSAFRAGLITDEDAFLNMLDDRNKSSHIYSQQEAGKIFQNIKNSYVAGMEKLLKNLNL